MRSSGTFVLMSLDNCRQRVFFLFRHRKARSEPGSTINELSRLLTMTFFVLPRQLANPPGETHAEYMTRWRFLEAVLGFADREP
jgi:hypothetical protein